MALHTTVMSLLKYKSKYSTVKNSTVQYNTVLYSIVQYSTVKSLIVPPSWWGQHGQAGGDQSTGYRDGARCWGADTEWRCTTSSHQSCRHLLHSDTFRATFNISRHPVDCQQLQLSVFPGHGHHHLIQPAAVNTFRLFIGGEDESWEYLVSVECSKRQFLNIWHILAGCCSRPRRIYVRFLWELK